MAIRYSIGDKVMVSRTETGEDHEEGLVVDSYELLIGEERKPMVVVEFEDGERQYIVATTPNVLPVEVEEEDESDAEAEGAEPGDAEDEELWEDEEEDDGIAELGDEDEITFVDEDEEDASP